MRRKLIKTGVVASRLGVSTKTIEKWANDIEDDFPKPVRKNNRMYWDEREVDAYIERMFAQRDQQQVRIRRIFRNTR